MNRFGSPGWLLLGMALLAVTACDGDDSSPTEPTRFVFTFTADRPAEPNSVAIEVVAEDEGLRFRAVGTQLADLHSYEYTVSLPPGLLHFAGGTADFGTLLVGATGSGEADDDSFGFEVSLPEGAPGQNGSGSVGSAGRYDMVAAGEGRVEFSSAVFRDPFGRPLEGLSLIGGTLRVSQSS